MLKQNPDIEAALARFHQLHKNAIDLSMGRVERLLHDLGNPHKKLPPVIHIAGTNGKGSTQAFLRAILEAHGYKVHAYISPNLIRFNERIRLAGQLIDDDFLLDMIGHCERVNDGQPITFFEMTTALAFEAFSRVSADIVLLEVGLGGRMDATNVIDHPLLSVITPVSYDHMDFLGNDIGGIAREKAGIIKRGHRVIVGAQPYAQAIREIADVARSLSAPACFHGEDWFYRQTPDGMRVHCRGYEINLPHPVLLGDHQYHNAALAVAGLRHIAKDFPVDDAALAQGLVTAKWPARMQKLGDGNLSKMLKSSPNTPIYVDGGHNEDGGKIIAAQMQKWRDAGHQIHLIVGMKQSKDFKAFLQSVVPLATQTIAVPIGGNIAYVDPQKMREAFTHIHVCDTPEAALAQLDETTERPIILFAGSLYLAAEILHKNGEIID